MAWGGLLSDGSYALVPDEAYPNLRRPIFTFPATDVADVQAFLGAHYVHFEVRWGDENRLAYFLSAPDLSPDVVSVVVPSRDHVWIQSGHGLQNQHATRIVDDHGGELWLDTFTKDVAHDWTQICAKAEKSVRLSETAGAQRDDYIDAALEGMRRFHADMEATAAYAHQLYGRIWQMKGELEMARHHHAQAIRLSVRRGTDVMIPAAAGPLLDLALAFESSKDIAPARVCLLHALAVRPGYAAALAALAQLTPDDEVIVSNALARIAAVGGREALLGSTARIVADASGRSAEALVRSAEADAAKVDWAHDPFARPGHGSLEQLERDAGLGEAPPEIDEGLSAEAEPQGYRDAPARAPLSPAIVEPPVEPQAPESERRPWWKIW